MIEVEKMKADVNKNTESYTALEDYVFDIKGFLDVIANNALVHDLH